MVVSLPTDTTTILRLPEMATTKQFSNRDIADYYDHTEVHYRMWWKADEAMGLHYGVWDEDTRSTTEAILNVNRYLIRMGDIKPTDRVLDAGCGIGGSSIFLAKELGCETVGITLSDRQVATATRLAAERGLSGKCTFRMEDYTRTSFPDDSFDVVWAIESLGSAPDKALFFKEMRRILRPGGRIVIADTFKPKPYDITQNKTMLTMLNGWAISDILSIQELQTMAAQHGFGEADVDDVSPKIEKSVQKLWWAGVLGAIGTKVYNLFKNATPFSKIHYKTGLAQRKAYRAGSWGYYLVALRS